MAMSDPETPTASTDDDPTERRDDGLTVADLEAQVELVEAENRRLRNAVSEAKRSNYRRAAAGHGLLGVLALVGGLVFPDVRTVLFALGGTGLFIGVLTYYLTPERFIPASVGERVYAALADTIANAVTELGLSEQRIYVPRENDVRLYVPQRDGGDVPDEEALDSTFVIDDDRSARGMATEPTGRPLYDELRSALTGPEPTTARDAATQLRDGLVEVFELGDAAEVDVETSEDGGRVTIELTNSVYEAANGFDNPAVSLVAVGLATAVNQPVRAEVTGTDPLVASFRWNS